MEIFDLADARLGATISVEYPSVNGYEPENLLVKHNASQASGVQLLSPLNTATGFMAESFVKPPVELTLTLPFQSSLAAIAINPRVRMHMAKHVSLFMMSERGQRWEYLGRLQWPSDNDARPLGLCNQELHPATVEQAMNMRGCLYRPSSWRPIERASESLHFVSKIKIRIASMHNSVALGFGGLEVWAQPSQRLPWQLREQAWTQVRQAALARNSATAVSHAQNSQTALADCPPEFVDPITQNMMRDPVILPSNARCDRTTIARHLAAHTTDPFTGLPMDSTQIRTDLALQLRIRAWLNSQ
ncbi:RING finger protein 37 [Coemansia sp. RSA 2711]|nr:RING finger protein 37 [Coemansia sp. RSA 2711]